MKQAIIDDFRAIKGVLHGALIPLLLSVIISQVFKPNGIIPYTMVFSMAYIALGFYIYNIEGHNPIAKKYFNWSGGLTFGFYILCLWSWVDTM